MSNAPADRRPAAGRSAPGSQGPAGALCCLLPGLALWLVTFPFVYRGAAGDDDTIRMVNGMLWAQATGQGFAAGHFYALPFTFGYYALLFWLPPAVLGSAAALLEAVNRIGHFSAALACGAVGLFVGRLHGVAAGLAAAILVGFSPMVLELATYGHPLLLSVTLLLAGGWVLLAAEGRAGPAGMAGRIAAGALLVASLVVRTDSLLAFPWLALVFPSGAQHSGRLRRVLARCVVLAGAAVIFLILQHRTAGPGFRELHAAGNFLSSFYRPAVVLKGMGVLALAAGIATLAAGAFFLVRGGSRRNQVPAMALLGIALVVWIPNPTPCRHFFYALLALGELVALGASRWLGTMKVVGLAVLIALANQVVAEVLYRPVARRYPWLYPATAPRRATGAVPLGWFLPNHSALGQVVVGLRAEGREVARAQARDIVVFADNDSYLILGLLEGGGLTAWVDTVEAGFRATRIERPGQTFHLVQKAPHWPRDVAAEYLAADPFPGAKVYVQPLTRSRFDRAPVPGARELKLGD